MESVKKILPYILVAIIFAVGGYFIGHGSLSNQGAALYKGAPKNSAGIFSVYTSGGNCWMHNWDVVGAVDVEGILGADGGCWFLKEPIGGGPTPSQRIAVYFSNGNCWLHNTNGSPDIEGTVDSSGGCYLALKPRTDGTKPIMSSVPVAPGASKSVKTTPTTR